MSVSQSEKAAREVHEHGTFGYLDRGLTSAELNAFMTS